MAIKLYVFHDKLKEGLEKVEDCLDLWKNTVSTTNFPTDLKSEFIGATILRYYIEPNLNPLESQRPVIRAMHQRGQSATH